MTAADQLWARAYAQQALSDLEARESLAIAGAEKCHRLHYLQMAAEKVCKAHLTIANGHDAVRRTHGYTARNLPQIARMIYPRLFSRRLADWQIKAIARLALEIELVAPALNESSRREDNAEYPWTDGTGTIQTPCLYSFPNIDDSMQLVALVIRLLRAAAESYL